MNGIKMLHELTYSRQRQIRLQQSGLCIACANPRGDDGTTLRCYECRVKHNRSTVACKRRKSERAKRARDSAISTIIAIAADLVKENHPRGVRLRRAIDLLKLTRETT